MTIQRQAHFEQKMRRDAHVLITRHDVQYEARDRKSGHEAGDPDESPHIAAKQCGVYQQLGEIWLHQTNARRQQAHQSHRRQPLGVWQEEAESPSILSEPDSCGRHFKRSLNVRCWDLQIPTSDILSGRPWRGFGYFKLFRFDNCQISWYTTDANETQNRLLAEQFVHVTKPTSP